MPRPFQDKEIVLGVTGSIAAYKACDLASRLVEAGARVRAVLTQSAREFVGPASFEGITGRRVITEMFESLQNPDIEHISVARTTDLFLIAPATANILAKAAHGVADDWLSTTLLATRAPILFAPAMNTDMYGHPATQANIDLLKTRGCHFVGPGAGMLACRTVGPGRLIDTPAILEAAGMLLCKQKDLAGKHVLITSGANHEPIDPVRFIGNRSSGRMGRALAFEALCRGARVTVVTGPAEVELPCDAEVVRVQTAREMHTAVMERIATADIFIAAAAVADYHLSNPSETKHKRNGEPLSIALEPNPDIVAQVGAAKRNGQFVIGFAAETHDLMQHATEKLRKKHLDLIIANEVGGAASAIGADQSNAHLLFADGRVIDLPQVQKAELAAQVFDAL